MAGLLRKFNGYYRIFLTKAGHFLFVIKRGADTLIGGAGVDIFLLGSGSKNVVADFNLDVIGLFLTKDKYSFSYSNVLGNSNNDTTVTTNIGVGGIANPSSIIIQDVTIIPEKGGVEFGYAPLFS